MLADYNTAILALSGIQNYWPLGEASGTSFADSQASNTATASTAPGRVTGPDGVAVAPDFAATSGKVLVPGSSVTLPNSHTFCYWLKLNSQGAADAMALEWATASFAKYCQHDIGYSSAPGTNSLFAAFYGTVAGATGRVAPRSSFPNGAWHFIAVTLGPSTGSVTDALVYLDGVLIGTTAPGNVQQTSIPGAGTLGIGGRGQGSRGLPLDGALQGVAMFNRVLTTTEMGTLRTAMLSGSAPVDFTLSASGSGSTTLSLSLTPNISLTGTATSRAYMDPRTRNAGERSLSGSVVTIANDALNNSFPGIAKLATGDLIAIYRAGATHTSVDGVLRKKTSSDNGATWSSATTILGAGATTDYRDPGVLVCADGTVVVSFFAATSNAAFDNQAPMTIRSTDDGATWSSPVAVDHPFTLAGASSGPAIQLQTGDLLMAVYGWDSLLSNQWITVAKSTDLGVSWDHLTTLMALQAGHDLSECNLLQMGNGEVIAMVRDDHGAATPQLQSTFSRDNGATWATPTVAIADAGGRVGLTEGPERDIIVMYRDHVDPSYGQTFWRSSWDFGRTWGTARTINSSRVYTYGQWVTIDAAGGNDALAVVYAVEPAANNADVFFQKFTAPSTPNFTFTATGTATGILSIANNDLSMTATGTGFATLTLHPPSANTSGTVRLRFSRAHPVDLTFSRN